ncbi:MAG: hypothetical protein M0Q91_05280 [Methanoregula sp.]|nr:hypothetical protein [Methanoregula sp.]
MTNKCQYLESIITERKTSATECTGNQEQCPKDRLKCIVGQSCWQVRK